MLRTVQYFLSVVTYTWTYPISYWAYIPRCPNKVKLCFFCSGNWEALLRNGWRGMTGLSDARMLLILFTWVSRCVRRLRSQEGGGVRGKWRGVRVWNVLVSMNSDVGRAETTMYYPEQWIGGNESPTVGNSSWRKEKYTSMDREKERVMCELTFLFGSWERLERRHQEPEVDHTERGQLMKHGPWGNNGVQDSEHSEKTTLP